MPGANLPTSHIEAPANPNVEGVDGGANAASTFCGVGIAASATVNPKAQDWSREEKAPKAQPLGWGGDSIVTGQLTADLVDLLYADYLDGDFNNLTMFDVADTAVSGKGAIYNTTNNTALASDLLTPIQAGEWVWGQIVVA